MDWIYGAVVVVAILAICAIPSLIGWRNKGRK